MISKNSMMVCVLGISCLALMTACMKARNGDVVKGKVAAILLTKAGDDGTLVPFKTIQDQDKVEWFSKRLNEGKSDKYDKFFGTVFGPQIFVDDKGNVIAATVCRMPENVACLASVEKTEKGYVLKSVAEDMGINDKEYVQKAADESDVKALP